MSSGFYHLYFIKDFLTPLQNAAFDAVSSYENLEPVWIAGMDAIDKFKNSSPKSCCFVFGKFTGPSYEHFKALGSAVFGPQALLDYLREEKPLPNISFPLFSTALRNANVTVTSVAGQLREYLFSSIEMLHGVASRNLTDDVNVIISPKVGSKKYVVGAKRGISIVTPEWIDEAWKLSEALDPIDMLSSNFLEKFKLPMFNQLVVCVSGLTLDERKEVAKIVSANGGLYSGEMKIGFTTHLIVKKAEGVKYNFAKKWKIQIVNDRWLTDSVNAGYALECADYEVQDNPNQTEGHKHSTPTSSMLQDPSFLRDVSAITDSKTCDETRFSCLKDVTNINHSRFLSEQLYLCGCVILLYGCDSAESSSLSALIKAAGGVSCVDASDKVTASFTHVVLGPLCKKIPSSDLEQDVHYVTSEWLEKCLECRKRLPEEDFKPEFLSKTEVPEQNQIDQVNSEARVDEEDIRLINEYFKGGNVADLDDFLTLDNGNNGNSEEQIVQEEKIQQQQGEAEERDETKLPVPHTQESETPDEIAISREGLFSHLTFKPDITFSITANPALCSAITDEGGTVINDSSVEADYTICPYVLRQAVTPTMVTPYWIHSCLAAKALLISELDTEIGFRPVHIPASVPSLPLEDCAISLSGFVSNDRLFLSDLAKGLGATVQECFLRKAIPSRNLLASTHLVAARPDGRKWPAAQSWGIPSVSCSWLFACAVVGKRVPEFDHPVKENDPMAPKDWTKVINLQEPMAFQTPHQTPKTTANRQSVDNRMLKTPAWVKANQAQTPVSGCFEGIHVSPPMSEKVSRCLKQALLKSTMSGASLVGNDLKSEEDNRRSSTGAVGILEGVVICVARSLSDRQITLNDLAKQLGGDFRWHFDKSACTHMIACPSSCYLPPPSPMFQGRELKSAAQQQPILAEDVRAALDTHHMHVVLPQWLEQCQRLGKRLPESEYLAFPKPSSSTALSNPQPSTSGAPAAPDTITQEPLQQQGSAGGDESSEDESSPSSPRSRRRRSASQSDGDEEALAAAQFASSGSNLALPPAKNDFITPGQSIQVRWQYEDSPKVVHVLPSPHEDKRNSPFNEFNKPGEKQASPEKKTPRPSVNQPSTSNANRSRVFSVSGVTQDEKVRYQAIITELGADLDAGMTVGESTTHLIINAPSRCEKYLMCLAGGRWILHKSYLDACAAANTWLPEEAYEWGGPGTEPLLIQLSPAPNSGRSGTPGALSCVQLRELAKAARHWRRAGGKAFEDWKVVFGPGCDRESSFRRIIEYGGGKVLANSVPYPPADQVTHAFIKRRSNTSSRSSSHGDASRASAGCQGYEWLKVEFLCAHLTGMGNASRSEYVIDLVGEQEATTAPPPAKRSRKVR